MKILLLNQFFHPDLSATAQIATDLAEDLAADGFSVTAVASRGTYLGGERLPARGVHGDAVIHRVAATSLGKRTLVHRALDYGSFYASAAVRLATLPRHDALVALTTPPLIAATGLVAKALRGTKLVYWVQDLYPEVAVAFGALRRGSLLERVMAATSRAVMRRADAVVALGDAMRERCVEAGARPERTHVVPNWADGASVCPHPPEGNAIRTELAAGARVLVMYSGNMGRAHDLGTLLAAARQLSDRPDIAFLFVGDGARRIEVERASRELRNVRLAAYQPRERLAEALSAGDLHLVSLAPEVEGLLEPSKLYGIMAAGRPCLFVGPERCEAARTIAREGCGSVFRNGDSAALAGAIRALADDERARAAIGGRARTAFEQRYDRSIATRRFGELLRSVRDGGAC
jgi:glycosyltransferase involved in cell wall biosynthesis